MGIFLTRFLRRTASTALVLVALFVACMSVQAAPCGAPVEPGIHAAFAVDQAGIGDDIDPAPSLEDNTVSLDDTFDVPRQHALHIARGLAVRPTGLNPDPHAHDHSFELRPPIA
jgi:hypothetical protein